MEIFDLGIKILLIVSLPIFIIFFYFSTSWAEEFHPERKYIIGFMVTILHFFWIFVAGFFFVVFLSLLVKFLSLIPKT